MSAFTASEATSFFRSYNVKCDEKLVQQWMSETNTKHTNNNQVCEDDLYQFNNWCRWKGTAYEEGIDNQTKIARLLEEINGLKNDISSLKKEKEELEAQLEIMPF